ncbi:MAG: hypothetical protein EA397_04805 [Deltaproteobacteria bacterium]|nr:MAG: hypothetical protein EA397_04805 [Deltaproteobacteria bacterium]
MILAVLWLVAQVISTSAVAASRPALTFFLVQLGLGGGVLVGWVALPPLASWTVSLPALVLGGVAAFVEVLATLQPELDEIFTETRLTRMAGGLSAAAVATLFAASGLPIEVDIDVDAAQLGAALAVAERSGHPWWVQLPVIVFAVAVNLGLGPIREKLQAFAHSLGVSWYVAVMETGGVIGILLLVPFLPPLTLAVVVLLSLVFGALALSARLISARIDRRSRRPCPSCRRPIRVEAGRCPGCRAVVFPSRWIGQAWAPWRTRGQPHVDDLPLLELDFDDLPLLELDLDDLPLLELDLDDLPLLELD